jgi:hypothetical protein
MTRRKKYSERMLRKNMMVTDAQWAIAFLLGNGNASDYIQSFLQDKLDRLGVVRVVRKGKAVRFLNAAGDVVLGN